MLGGGKIISYNCTKKVNMLYFRRVFNMATIFMIAKVNKLIKELECSRIY